MIKGLPLKGIEGQFALQTALISFEEKSGTVILKLATDIVQLATPSSIEKLTQALSVHLNKPVKIILEKNDQVITVANLEAQDQAIAQTKLESEVAVDPFLEKLKSELGVTVIQGSIRPLS
jgi:DNA polymerase-3 subunit gamma/tau